MEHASEQQHQVDLVDRLMHQGRRIPLRMLLNIAEYPRDMEQVMALYAEGYSLSRYLIQLGGRQKFLRFLDDAHRRSWNQAIQSFYERTSIEQLEADWSRWVIAGRPSSEEQPRTILASGQTGRASGQANEVVRSQTPHLSPVPNQRPVSAPRPAKRSRTPGLARILRSGLGPETAEMSTQTELPVEGQTDSPTSQQRLVPLALTPLTGRKELPVDIRITRSEQFPVPTVSEEAAFGRQLRETHIRIRDLPLPVPVRTGTWTRFPQRIQ